MINALGMEWMPDPSIRGKTLGSFSDAHDRKHQIGEAAWRDGCIYLGTIVLTPEMCAELAMILNYIAYSGKLPEPNSIDS